MPDFTCVDGQSPSAHSVGLHSIALRANEPLELTLNHDDIAGVRNARIVGRGVAANVETLFLHSSYHMVTGDKEHREVAMRSAEFFAHRGAAGIAQPACA